MSAIDIRQSFLDFFKGKGHTIVPSASLLPTSPNLLFTNAGMNQFVPIFLGQQTCPYKPGRAADTQKCIRAGGKHNDLEDVGLDTYHHTFFEMLGNWSFGDYFKQEAIPWAWELLTQVWKFPPARLYATVYSPDKTKNDPADFDQEAYDLWAGIFTKAGLDPKVHIVHGNKKDNFWMMGETGPCGPCSELHVDLTPAGDTRGALVNKASAECIEIWNLVFIQFNANADGSFSALPARHVDTGMGFERVSGILECTRHFTDFSRVISNYESSVFHPLFDELQKLSGKRYASTLPAAGSTGATEQEKIDVAFRVIADHIRTLGFAIADGILPGNTDRHYVLRRILRRAVRYGRVLGFHQPFFYKLVDVLAENMGDVFPEIRTRKEHVQEVLRVEEESFNRTLDRGLDLFNEEIRQAEKTVSGDFAFKLYDTYGFPLDLTELMAREKGLAVDTAGFDRLMAGQKARARAAQKKEVIEVSQVETTTPTRFVGYEHLQTAARVQEVLQVKGRLGVILDVTACYPEMGGQVGDTGELDGGGQLWRIVDTQKVGHAWLHFVEGAEAPAVGEELQLTVDLERRHSIQRHHTATHLLHWALHEVVSQDVAQKGSYVGPDKLTLDFNSAALTPEQLTDVERLVNARILENAEVSGAERQLAEIKDHKGIRQIFGEKYGDVVRVIQVGGRPLALDGYSMELCGGTHVSATGDIGLFRIVAESAVAAGVRRIEAVCGWAAYELSIKERDLLRGLAQQFSVTAQEIPARVAALAEQNKQQLREIRKLEQKDALARVGALLAGAQMVHGVSLINAFVGEMGKDALLGLLDALSQQAPDAILVLGSTGEGKAQFVAAVPDALVKQGYHAGKLIKSVAALAGGGGGGQPNRAQAGGKDGAKAGEAIRRVEEFLAKG